MTKFGEGQWTQEKLAQQVQRGLFSGYKSTAENPQYIIHFCE
jgi:hypothetical protein